MTLRARARLLLVVMVVAMLALGTLVGVRFYELQQVRSSLTEQVYPASELTVDYLYGLVRMSNGLAAYADTGDPEALAEFEAGQVATARAAAGIEQLLTGELAPLRQQLTAASQQREEWLRTQAAPVLNSDPIGQSAPDLSYGTFPGATAVSALLMDLNDRMVVGISETNQIARRLAVALEVLAAFFVALTLAVVWATRAWVLSPLANLGSQMTQLTSSAATDVSLTPSGPPEVADVGVRAEMLRQQLVGQIASAQAAHEGLDQESPVVAALQPLLGPAHTPELPGVVLGVARLPAQGVIAGDWWDALPISVLGIDALAGAADGAAVAVGDVSGHGPEAGVAAVRLRTALRSSVDTGADLRTAVAHATGLFAEQPSRFSSLVALALLDTEVRWLNAGHNEPFLLRPGRRAVRLPVTGPVLSALGGRWYTAAHDWQKGDVVVLFTDGLVEARTPEGSELGEEQVRVWGEQLLAQARHESAAQRAQFVAAGLLDRVRMAAADIRRDDVTVIVIEHT